MDIIEGSLLTAARGHSLAAVSASDSTPALNAQRLSLTFIYGIGKPVRWGRRKCMSSHPAFTRRSNIVDAKYK